MGAKRKVQILSCWVLSMVFPCTLCLCVTGSVLSTQPVSKGCRQTVAGSGGHESQKCDGDWQGAYL